MLKNWTYFLLKKSFVPPVHLRPFQGSCTLLLGQLQQAGWTKFPKKSGAKKMTLTAWGCRFLVESGRLWHPGLEAISKPSWWEDLEGEKRIFLGDIWSLKIPTMLKKSDEFGERGDEKQVESSLNWSEMLGVLLHSTDSSSPLYSSF